MCPLVECLSARSVVQVVTLIVDKVRLHRLHQGLLRNDLISSVDVIVAILERSDGLVEIERLLVSTSSSAGLHEGLKLHDLVV